MTVELFRQELQVLNVGLALFADAISSAGGKVTAIEWAPPARGDCDAARALARLVNHPRVEAANRRAFDAYLSSQPVIEGISVARDAIPEMGRRMILHAGPPVAWNKMCGPVNGADGAETRPTSLRVEFTNGDRPGVRFGKTGTARSAKIENAVEPVAKKRGRSTIKKK